jgi:hypothetical protein
LNVSNGVTLVHLSLRYRLESIQRRTARFSYNDYGRTTSVTEMMKKLDWKPLSERRREQRLILMYKIVNDLIAIPAETHITLPGL